MVHLVKKVIKGNTYLYLEETARIDGKPTRIWQKYLGSESKMKEQAELQLKPEFTVTTLDYGFPLVLMHLIKKLELIEIINDCTGKRAQGLSVGHYIALATINRCVKPTSKARIRRWFENTALFKEFPPVETYLDSMAYTNHFKYLTPEVINEIETRIHENLLSKFEVDMKTLFYDPTNFFTYINPKPSVELPRHGHSKEGRSTLNLIGLTLFCTKDGALPVMHEVYPGNVQDARLFRDEISRLLKRLKRIDIDPRELCLVFDKGNISEEAFEQINASGMHFIASIRPSMQKDLSILTPKDFFLEKLPNGKEVGVLEYDRKIYGPNDRLFVVYNPRRREWQENNLKAKLEKRISEVNHWFNHRLNVKKWRDPKSVEKKIRDIIKTKKALNWISYSVSGKHAHVKYSIKIKKKVLNSHLDTLGKSYLLSNHPDMTPLDIVWLFRQQFTVERAFKYIKMPTTISVRPIFHRKDDSIRGHLFTCVLGLLLLMLLTRKIQSEFKEMSLLKIVETLSEIELAVINFKGSKKSIRKIVKTSEDAEELSKFFDLEAHL